jgi:hypothetical protein
MTAIWEVQQPGSIDKLLTALNTSPLDRRYELYGNFIHRSSDGSVTFWGAFFHSCCSFKIITDNYEVVSRLTAAIRNNQTRADYLSQPRPQVANSNIAR